jgi:glucosamine-phosphate N-acetyltransferase
MQSYSPEDPRLQAIAAGLPAALKVRLAEPEDFQRGHLALLQQLTTVGNISSEQYAAQLQRVRQSNGYLIVIVDTEKNTVVGTTTLLVEPKIIHECGSVGHIEDVVVCADYRGAKLGKLIIQYATELAGIVGCYKTILDCSDATVGFYEACGYRKKEVQMRYDHPKL